MRLAGLCMVVLLVAGLACGGGNGLEPGLDTSALDAGVEAEEVLDAFLPPESGPEAVQPDGGEEADTAPDLEASDVGPDGGCNGCAGHPCTGPAECFSGACVDTMNGKVCSEACGGEESCPKGWICAPFASATGDPMNVCLDPFSMLCRPCRTDAECVPAVGAGSGPYICVDHGPKGRFCGAACETDLDCPEGFACEERETGRGKVAQCVPKWGQACSCTPKYEQAGYTTTCWIQNANGRCEGERTCADDCDAKVPAAEVCNGVDDNCDGKTDEAIKPSPCTVKNEHGSCKGTTQCVDGKETCDAMVPAPEACGGVDDDCDGELNEEGAEGCLQFSIDTDADGYGAAGGATRCLCVAEAPWSALEGGDCDDGDSATHPGAGEACNGKDDDCDGTTDPDGSSGCSPCFQDIDSDGFGSPVAHACVCAVVTLPAGCAEVGGDCDDEDPEVHPLATETCNGKDDDCDGAEDPEVAGGCDALFLDGDGDGFGMPGQSRCLCEPAGKYTATKDGDCDDGDNEVHPLATEECNGKDDDCEGGTDEAGATGCSVYYKDQDEDTYGVDSDKTCLCAPAAPYTSTKGGECDDNDKNVHPGAAESCNGRDDDCAGGVDPEGSSGCTERYLDADGDGSGDPAFHKCLCTATGQYTAGNDDDCCDKDAAARPGQSTPSATPNACGKWDFNCDGNAQKMDTALGNCDWCQLDAGWKNTVPECGVTAEYIVGCSWCTADTENRVQRCL